jgi:hypothetical protein
MRESLTVKPIHAVVGANPKKTTRVLRDRGHHQIRQSFGAAKHPKLELAAWKLAGLDRVCACGSRERHDDK